MKFLLKICWDLLVNIIKNGLESIEIKGKIEVIAAAEGNYGIIKISNNGKPIPKDKQKDIFNVLFITDFTYFHTTRILNYPFISRYLNIVTYLLLFVTLLAFNYPITDNQHAQNQVPAQMPDHF